MDNECPECGKSFKNERGVKSHYGQVHGSDMRGVLVDCQICGNEVRRLECRISDDRSTVCSNECKEKLLSKMYKGSNNPNSDGPEWMECKNCNKKYDLNKVRGRGVYCSRKCMGEDYKERLKGEDNPNYSESDRRDGFTDSERVEIFERDDYTCQDCSRVGGQLNAHHILPVSERPDKSNDISNGVTLCIRCHANRHKGENIYHAIMSLVNDRNN